MKISYCDKCGRELVGYKDSNIVTVEKKHRLDPAGELLPYKDKELDMCAFCLTELYTFLADRNENR